MRHLSRTAVAIAVGSVISMSAEADILISEYVEGGSFNKAIEIANTGQKAVSLDGYILAKSANGNGEWGAKLPLDGITIQAKEVYVFSREDAAEEIKAVTDQMDTAKNVINFNGDDPVAILNADGSIHDIVGVMGDVDFGKDKTLVRRVYTPSVAYDVSQWEAFPKDNFDDLGQLGDGVDPTDPVEPPQIFPTTIMELQGDSWASPYTDPANGKYISDKTFLVEGVVTAIQNTALGKDLPIGFFMQDENGDGNPKTSDGIFVPGNITGLTVGDRVQATGKVEEAYGWTQLKATKVEATGGTGTIVATAIRKLESDEEFAFTLERHEGMLVKMDKEADMRVARTYGFDFGPYRSNMVVSHKSVNMHPNQHNAPGSEAAQKQADCNEDMSVVVESFVAAPKGQVPWYPTFGDDNGTGATDQYIRIGDIVDGLEGVLTYSYGDYRFYVTNTATEDTFVREGTDRTEKPVLKDEGDIRVATFNVLNYFNSPFGGAENPHGGNRGATSLDEFELQATKIVKAILTIDADIVGLMEIENNGFGPDSAVVSLVERLNADREEADKYTIAAKVDLDYVGTDAITSQVIYKTSKVGLEELRVIPMPQQHAPTVDYTDLKGKDKNESGSNYMRDSITPTFTINDTDEKLTVSVNHFKSKGSTCWEDVQTGKQLDDDQQGSCENFRVSGAYHLGKVLASIEGHKLIIGDLNSYAGEDAVTVLTNREHLPEGYQIKAARDTFIGGNETTGEVLHGNDGAVIDSSYGYTNMVKLVHPDSYGYSYNDEVGTLDYVLASPGLVTKVADVTEWNINSAESTLFQYEDKNNCDKDTGTCSSRHPDVYRSSDHDPAIVALNFKLTDPTDPTDPTVPVPSQPIDMPEVTGASPGEAFDMVFDLTNTQVDSIKEGTVAQFILTNENQLSVATYSKAFSDTLSKNEIEQGWTLIEVDGLEKGDYTFKKYIGEQFVGEETLVIGGKTLPVVDEDKDGGSTGLFGLLALLGLGFFRRKIQK